MFTFGTQYLRGASPDRSEWEKDMIHMRDLGFNTIRIWIVWNAFEDAVRKDKEAAEKKAGEKEAAR